MTPDEAHTTLTHWSTGEPVDVRDVRDAWLALDGALSAGGTLPEAWDRLTATRAAERAGKPSLQRWLDLVNKGYAPAPDGTDETGRYYWLAATVDAYLSGDWQRQPASRPASEPPPTHGTGATQGAWARWAQSKGVDPTGLTRTGIQAACRAAGLIE